jgi:hypothetical protein
MDGGERQASVSLAKGSASSKVFPESVKLSYDSEKAMHQATVERSKPSVVQSIADTVVEGEKTLVVMASKASIIDSYAIKEKPATSAGGIITIFVWLAVVAYTVWTTYVWLTRPWVTTSETLWTYSDGPWPMRLRCRAMSGCYVSNRVQAKWAPNVPLDPSATALQSACTYLSPGDWFEFSTSFSNSPNDGMSIAYIPSPSSAMTLPSNSTPTTIVPTNFGAEIESFIVCGPGTNATLIGVPCIDGSLQLMSPIQSGVTLLFLVETTNASATGRSLFRREWYPTQVSNDGTLIAATSTCNFSSFNSSWVQGRIRLNAQFAKVDVTRDSIWLVIWGAVGGAMALFFQVGGMFLGGVGIVLHLLESRRQRQ